MSTATTILGLEKQDTGANNNAWGTVLNTQLDLIEAAVAGSTSITLSSSDVTLTTTDYSANQARASHLALSGTITANCNVIVPAKSKLYCVTNSCTQATAYQYSVTVKTSGGTGVVIPASTRPVWVRCDGTNVEPLSIMPAVTIASETEVSLASTTNEVLLTFASGDVTHDPLSMADAANNKIVFPAGTELVSISLNLFLTATIASTTLCSAIIQQKSGSPGSIGQYPYEAVYQRRGTGSTYTPLSASCMFNLADKALGGTDRGMEFQFLAQLDTSTSGVACSGWEAHAVILR